MGKADLLANWMKKNSDLIGEDSLEVETGQADLVQERIDLAII